MPKRAKPTEVVETVKETEPTALGRPTSYQPDYTEPATMLCSNGATDRELAEFFDVTERTINRWKLTHAEFAEACKAGKDAADERVQRSLYHRAMGIEYDKAMPVKLKKITYDDKGKKLTEEERVEVVTVKELIPPDTTAMIFWLKNRRSKEWRDVHKHEHGGAGAFDHLDDNELKEFIEGEFQEIKQEQLPPPEPVKQRGRATKH